jgi:RNA polymerase subunit RPABC4/transcription elongation factor Spt4
MEDATLAVPVTAIAGNEEFAVPNSLVRLRACLGCRLILPFTQFVRSGCPNCPGSDFQGDRSGVENGTTKNFTGCVGIADPSSSWVARHLRVELSVPGMYAILAAGAEEHQEEEPDEYEEDGGGVLDEEELEREEEDD